MGQKRVTLLVSEQGPHLGSGGHMRLKRVERGQELPLMARCELE